jgi:hypothetical protein
MEKESAEASFTMEYEGVTYTEVDPGSLLVSGGSIGIAGTGETPFGLIIIGVGDDGSTTEISYGVAAVTLDFGAVIGNNGFVATDGTIKRTGKKIEVDVSGLSLLGDPRTLTATIVVEQVITYDF